MFAINTKHIAETICYPNDENKPNKFAVFDQKALLNINNTINAL